VHADKLKTCYIDTPTASPEPTDDFEPAETVTASPAQPDKQPTNISQSTTPAKRPIKSRLKRQVKQLLITCPSKLMMDWTSMFADRK